MKVKWIQLVKRVVMLNGGHYTILPTSELDAISLLLCVTVDIKTYSKDI